MDIRKILLEAKECLDIWDEFGLEEAAEQAMVHIDQALSHIGDGKAESVDAEKWLEAHEGYCATCGERPYYTAKSVRELLSTRPAPTAQDSKVPKEATLDDAPEYYWQRRPDYNEKGAWVAGWNSCRKAMLSAAPVSEQTK